MVLDRSSSRSPEVQKSRKRRSQDEDDNGASRSTKRRHIDGDPLLKVLVPDYAAGALLGKGGSCLTDILDENGGVVRLSKKGEYYPGTNERIIMMSGHSDQIVKLNSCVMGKVRDPGFIVDDAARADIVKIVLTDESAGLLIGPKGKTIQEIHTTSGARLSIGVQCQASVRGERVLTISGAFEQLVIACRLVIEKIADEPTNVANSLMQYYQSPKILPVSYGGPGIYSGGRSSNGGGRRGAGSNGRSDDRRSPYSSRRRSNRHLDERLESELSFRRGNRRIFESEFQDREERHLDSRLGGGGGARYDDVGPSRYNPGRRRGGYQLQINVVASMDIPDEVVGGVMGRQGCVIKELAHRSGGARFKFSDVLNDNGEDRTLTITGSLSQITTACELVADRVEELTDPSVSLKSAR